MLPELQSRYAEFAFRQNEEAIKKLKVLEQQSHLLQTGINNIVEVMMQTASIALSAKLKELEAQQVGLEAQIQELHRQMQVECPSIELMGLRLPEPNRCCVPVN